MFSFFLAFLILMFDKIWLLKITLRNLVRGARNHGHYSADAKHVYSYVYICISLIIYKNIDLETADS